MKAHAHVSHHYIPEEENMAIDIKIPKRMALARTGENAAVWCGCRLDSRKGSGVLRPSRSLSWLLEALAGTAEV
jgi:hypothetical protein